MDMDMDMDMDILMKNFEIMDINKTSQSTNMETQIVNKYSQLELDHVLTNIKNPCTKRKNADYQWSEMVIFLLLKKNGCIKSKTDITLDMIHKYEVDERYYTDLLGANSQSVNTYITNFNNQSHYNNETMLYSVFETETNKIKEVYLTGKKITSLQSSEPMLFNVLSKVPERHRKGDIFMILEDDQIIGLSIKNDSKCQITNWSIEKMVRESGVIQELDDNLTQIRKNVLHKLIPNAERKEMKPSVKRQYFKYLMKDKDPQLHMEHYKTKVNNYIMDTLKDYFVEMFIYAVSQSKEVSYELYTFDGTTIKSHTELYEMLHENIDSVCYIRDDARFYETNPEYINIKSHYSKNGAKMWYYVKVLDKLMYRCEIRWKGDCDASPQMLLFNVTPSINNKKSKK